MRARAAYKELGITDSMHDEMLQAFKGWLAVQASDVLRLAGRYLGSRSVMDADAIMEALNAYFTAAALTMPNDVKAAINRVAGVAIAKLKKQLPDADMLNEEWANEYLERYYMDAGERLCRANEKDVERIITRTNGEGILEALRDRLTTWKDNRAKQMTDNEVMHVFNKTMINGHSTAGYQSVWRATAAECPACQALNGQTITTLSPPLHNGCMCTVEVGEKFSLLGGGFV